jgi:hypothetical protein
MSRIVTLRTLSVLSALNVLSGVKHHRSGLF